MAAQDAETKLYLSDPARFADAFNFFIYDGEEVIRPGDLQELNAAELAAQRGGGRKAVQKYRDLLRLCSIKHDGAATYVVLGIEAQTAVHYAMPVRAMLYDAMNYDRQVSRIAAGRRAEGGRMTGAEFLSGFGRDDRLKPVITLVINFSGAEWDGPLSVYDMLEPTDKRLLELVMNYRLNLLSPSLISEEDFAKFRTGLGAVMQFLKHQDDDGMDWMRGAGRFEHVDFETASLIKTVTGANIELDAGKETINMWPAWDNAIIKAKADGITEGRAEGEARGRAEGEARGRESERLNSIRMIMKNTGATAQRAMEMLGIDSKSMLKYQTLL